MPRTSPDPAFWRGRRVLLTGHTGFKGAWLSLWLQSLGAEVTGLSLAAPPSEPSLYELARVGEGMASVVCDIRDGCAVGRELARARPEIVIHMAAQPLVRRSFASPRETYATNVMGTVNVLDAVRACDAVRAVVVVTSDKCYENRETPGGYKEDDPLGGHDPYSSSKAAAEIVASAYRRSFFSAPDGPRLATARAGNVIGGGDWGADRLIPDIVRALVGATMVPSAAAGKTTSPGTLKAPSALGGSGKKLLLRNPRAVRPWQHVLCPLSGYLLLAQALCGSPVESREYARAWNFGPAHGDARTVEWIVRGFSELWPGGVQWEQDEDAHPHEATLLELDSSRAREHLGWAPGVALEEGLRATAQWYLAWREGADARELTLGQIEALSASGSVE